MVFVAKFFRQTLIFQLHEQDFLIYDSYLKIIYKLGGSYSSNFIVNRKKKE